MVLPLFVGREMSIKAIEVALEGNRMIFLTSQKDINMENPSPSDLYSVGTVGVIMRMLKLPDGRIKILVQGVSRAKTVKFLQKEPFYQVEIKTFTDVPRRVANLETEALMRNVKEQIEKLVSFGKVILPDIMVVIENVDDPGKLADLAVANMGLKVEQAQEILEITDPVQRIKRINEALGKEIELLSMQQKIQADVRGEIDKTQREYFLREQLKAIQRELGETDDRSEDMRELREKIKDAKMPEKAAKEAEKQLRRLERMHPDAAEASMTRTYIEWLAELPWSKATKDNLDLKAAHKVLEEDHYDLEKVKERILEYLAVRKLKEKMKGPILCFVGPPGVGKTSLGKSIARALGREFVRISLGGVRDEAEIRGHRRTYVGALPGRIIQGIKTAGNNNPVFMLDEIDKIGADFRGDPSAALLEVLDPEQNNSFSDHYIGLPFDLSQRHVHHHREHDRPDPGSAQGPHGDHPPVGLYGAGKARHRKELSGPPAADGARHHGQEHQHPGQDAPSGHRAVHARGRRAEPGARDRHISAARWRGRSPRAKTGLFTITPAEPAHVPRRAEVPARGRARDRTRSAW